MLSQPVTQPVTRPVASPPGAQIGPVGIVAPAGYIFLVDSDGTYLVDEDGAYLVEPV